SPEDRDLGAVEHSDLGAIGLLAVTLVGAKLKDARLVLGLSGWHFQLWHALEGHEQRAFHAYVGRVGRGWIDEDGTGSQILRVARHPIGECSRGLRRRVWYQHIKRRAARSNGDTESAHRIDPEAVHRRDGGVAIEIVDQFLLRTPAQQVSSQLVI